MSRVTLTVLLIASVLVAQEKTDKAIEARKNEGLKLTVESTVSGSVSIEAVLLPPDVTKGLFGKSVAERYVAVQVVVSNRSRDRALIVHNIFIDYSRWLLSGSSGDKMLQECNDPAKSRDTEKFPHCGNRLEEWQAETKANQIASAEYRLPRGTLLDAAPWTWRNLTVRLAEAAGSIASGYVFAFKEVGIAKGVASYNGNFLPALRYVLPDGTLDQTNRISDFGFRVNKVVAEDNSEMMVAFFPIDRFILPRLKKLFMKSPALFFVPHALVLDDSADKELKPILKVFGKEKDTLAAALRMSFEKKQVTEDVDFLNRLSLNTVRVLVSGSMVVDADSIPASIASVEMTGGNESVEVWQSAGERTGVIRGLHLTGGKPEIPNRVALGIESVDRIPDGSNDTELRFKFSGKPIASGQKVTFRVDKKDKSGRTVQGTPFDLAVNFLAAPPVIEKSEGSGSTLTITGKRMFATERTIRLVPSGVASVQPKTVTDLLSDKPTELKIDLAALNLPVACWTPEVTVVAMTARAATRFPKDPNPTISAAKKTGSRIEITGTDFIRLDCGKPLTFQIAEAKDAAEWKDAANPDIKSATQTFVDYPATPSGAAWKVRVRLGETEKALANVQP